MAPLHLVRNDGGFFSVLMLLALMASLLAAPLLLFLCLYGRGRWAACAVLAQIVLGFVTFAGGAQPLHAVYLVALGRPVEATVAGSTSECGHQVTGQAAETGPYVCTATLDLVGPDGEAVAGGGMRGNEFVGARLEAARTDGDPADSITVLEDPLGLARPLTADPATGWPEIGDLQGLHAVVLVLCWAALAGSLLAVSATGLRRRRTTPPAGADEPGDGGREQEASGEPDPTRPARTPGPAAGRDC
ncbi:hypothetical protein HS041_12750 [Planomonospora sp. ID67723]|uniref:hypothetical protein n=1 Tax=Planomonospora sp. ID67723 TaxID=2738134 RepID=UPI0018C38418|nr:hypothetical protein [Planomonospora sp. ID67723]MBG0828638.1 hypothetical protein [Planomonospora sp. ID67723]